MHNASALSHATLQHRVSQLTASALALRDDATHINNHCSSTTFITVMGRIGEVDQSDSEGQEAMIEWLEEDQSLMALIANVTDKEATLARIGQLVLEANQSHQETVIRKAITAANNEISMPAALDCAKLNSDINTAMMQCQQLIEQAKAIAGAVSEATKAIKDKFDEDIEYTTEKVRDLAGFEEKLEGISQTIAVKCKDKHIDYIQLSADIKELNSAQKAIELQKLSTIRSICHHFGERTKDVDGTQEKVELTIPENMHKGKGKALMDAVKLYFRGRTAQYYAIIPYIQRIIDDFDSTKKTYFKPPDVTTELDQIPEELRTTYVEMAKYLYSELMRKLPNAVKDRLRSSFTYGEAGELGLCAEHDGPMAIFALICHYRVSGCKREEEIRDYFQGLHFKMKSGDFKKPLAQARSQLNEAKELNVNLKWSTTGKRIYDTLSHNDHNMKTALADYKAITPADSQTRGLLDAMFAKIDHQCDLDEEYDQTQNPRRGLSVMQRMECRFGLKCNRSDCHFSHPDGWKADEAKSRQAAHPHKHTGKPKPRGSCQAAGCMDKKPLQGNRKLCTTCYKRAIDSGKTTIKLEDGSEIPNLGGAGRSKGTTPKRGRDKGTPSGFSSTQKAFIASALQAVKAKATDDNTSDDDTAQDDGGGSNPKKQKRAAQASKSEKRQAKEVNDFLKGLNL